jgi:hypothetical protein
MKTYLTLIMIALALPCGWAVSMESPAAHRPDSISSTADQIQQMPGYPIVNQSTEPFVGWGMRGVVLADLDGDSTLEVIHSSSSCYEYDRCDLGQVAAWDNQGNPVPGFPVATVGGAFFAPSVDDLDGDGDQEIVQVAVDASSNARLYLLDHTGSTLPGFPVAAGLGSIGDGATLYDLDLDGTMEIVYTSITQVHVFEIDGSQWSNGWPFDLNRSSHGTPAIGDTDADGTPEIFVAEGHSRMHLLRPDGSEMPGWPKRIPQTLAFGQLSSAALADIDGDLDLEIVVAAWTGTDRDSDFTEIHIYHHDGRPFTGWPQTTSYTYAECTPLVTDLEGDGSMEILFGTGYEDIYPIIYAWDTSGTLKPGFPYLAEGTGGEVSLLTVADYNGDGKMEIFADTAMADNADPDLYGTDWAGYVIGIDATGNELPGFPLRPFGSSGYNGVIIGDTDNDGDYELGVVSMDILDPAIYVNLYDLPDSYAASASDWLTFHAANSRGGLQKRQYTGWRFVYTGSRRGGGR